MDKNYRDFYKEVYWANLDTLPTAEGADQFKEELLEFVSGFDLADKKVLEIGSGAGKFQDVVQNYAGLDVVDNLKKLYRKPFFIVNPDGTYPFPEKNFDAIFTHAVFEHIPNIDTALSEMLRVLKPGGVILFHAAWQVRPWIVAGYSVRPYRDLDFLGRIIKATIPVRENIFFRLAYIVPKRIIRTIKYVLNKNFSKRLDYKLLRANYDTFWTSDSDACNCIDPHAAILWFMRNDCEVRGYPNLVMAFTVRTGSLVVSKRS